jgi:hypothetical protein
VSFPSIGQSGGTIKQFDATFVHLSFVTIALFPLINGEFMTPQDFTYWLQGFVEVTNAESISDTQWRMIKEHLALTTKKVTHTSISSPTDLSKWLDKYSSWQTSITC